MCPTLSQQKEERKTSLIHSSAREDYGSIQRTIGGL